ncbi:hypothetical protein LCGC14_2840750, partial [marine sediment metagenome]
MLPAEDRPGLPGAEENREMKSVAHVVLLTMVVTVAAGSESAHDRPGPLPRQWYTPHQLLPALAQRDGIAWAMPETLAGLALVGGDAVSARTALDEACKGWRLSWAESNGVVVVHRADEAKLQRWRAALEAGGAKAVEAAWELGWLRDGRAIGALAKALADKDVAVALAAAHAIQVL